MSPYLPVLCFAFFLFASSAFSSSVYCNGGPQDTDGRSWFYPTVVYPHLHCGDGDSFLTFSASGKTGFNMMKGGKCNTGIVQGAFDNVKADGSYLTPNTRASNIYARLVAMCKANPSCGFAKAMFEAKGSEAGSVSDSESEASLSGSEFDHNIEADHHEEH